MGSSAVLSNSFSYHVCRHCNKVFVSGKALGGHIRIHGLANGFSKAQSSRTENLRRADPVAADYSSSDVWVEKSNIPTTRSSENSKWVTAEEEEGGRNRCVEEEMGNQKMVSLYTLRRSPKPSKRFTDEEFSMDLNEKNYSTRRSCGAFVVAPSSGVSSECWPSSQGSENPQQRAAAAATSHDESDRESMKRWEPAASLSLPTWSVTAKRNTRKPIRSKQFPPDEDLGLVKMENGKQLEDDRDTANLLVMLASTGNTNTNMISVNGLVEKQMTEESVDHSKKGKPESQESGKDLEEKDNKKRKVDQTSFSKEELNGGGKYKCSTCKKPFNSHQALGGHRASHRKVKGCFAITSVGNDEMTEEEISQEGSSLLRLKNNAGLVQDDMMCYSPAEEDDKIVHLRNLTGLQKHKSPQSATTSSVKKKKNGKGHGCRICHKVFPSGQALGGHKRCHWIDNAISLNSLVSTEKNLKLLLLGQGRNDARMEPLPSSKTPLLDLNKPAPLEE